MINAVGSTLRTHAGINVDRPAGGPTGESDESDADHCGPPH
ncbi:hypothetical protein GZL_02888 [Streptomyces sp. 769]|nr:hypothetical protein GZL_02888 [Streptomyces sp. 769]